MDTKFWMRTNGGHTFYPLNPDVTEIGIETVAHHLAKLQRYTGAPEDDYTVAEHSVLISKALERDGYSPKICLQGLLHDSGEFAFNDQSRPLKHAVRAQFPAAYHFMHEGEAHVCRLLALKFGAGWPFDPVVSEYDDRIVVDEIFALFGREENWYPEVKSLNIHILKLPWRAARNAFHVRYCILRNKINGEGGYA